jgi:dihydrofolate reductase
MARLQWQFTMSLDGFMAGPGGDMSWLKDFLGSNLAVDEIMEETAVLLVGNNTFRGDDPYKDTPQSGEPYGGGWSGQQFVLTHNPPRGDHPGTTFVTDLESGVAAAKAAAGDKYVGVLGASVGRQCIQAGLLDEIFVTLAPVLLGDGVRMFDFPGGTNVKLALISQTEAEAATNLRMRVLH